jgi:hypothetical protein
MAVNPPQGIEKGKNYFAKSLDNNELRQCEGILAEFRRITERRMAYLLAWEIVLDTREGLRAFFGQNQQGRSHLPREKFVLMAREEEEDNAMHLLFAGNCLPHVRWTAPADLETKHLTPCQQTLILASPFELNEQQASAITAFVHAGGLVISFNKAIATLSQCFPGRFSFENGNCPTSATRIQLEVKQHSASDDHLLFECWKIATENRKVLLLSLFVCFVYLFYSMSHPFPIFSSNIYI